MSKLKKRIKAETVERGVVLYPAECLATLATLDESSVDSCVTDPPYHLTSIVKRFGAENSAPAKSAAQRRFAKTGGADRMPGPDQYGRLSRGFMGKVWDGGEIAFQPETWAAVYRVLKPGGYLVAFGAPKNFGFMQVAISQAGFEIRDVICWLFGSGFPKSHNLPGGFGTALKPAYEPIILARKPLMGTVAANVREHGTGALNIDGCRVATADALGGGDQSEKTKVKAEGWDRPWMQNEAAKAAHAARVNGNVAKAEALGRWPANVIHDGSAEVVEAFPETGVSSGGRIGNASGAYSGLGPSGFTKDHISGDPGFGDSGSAARFFYTAKADAGDRLGSKHPTVKPLDLMQYLVRLVTPPKGLVLDPFAGTGTTGEAAIREGMRAILIEREAEYQEDIRRRMKLAMAGPDERARESIKAKLKDKPLDLGPLFGGLSSA